MEAEAFAARTIAERGVQLVATAHGNSLDNLLMNPTLSDLVGGIQAVTLSDEEAKRRGTQKTVLERKAPPTFDVLIEIMEMDKLAIHHEVASIVDKMLRGAGPRPEIRVRNPQGEVEVVQPSDIVERPDSEAAIMFQHEHEFVESNPLPAIVKVFPYGVSRNRLERAIRELRVPAYITKEIRESNAVITLKTHERKDVTMLQEAKRRGVPTYVVKSNTFAQIAGAMRDIFHLGPSNEEEEAIQDAEGRGSRGSWRPVSRRSLPRRPASSGGCSTSLSRSTIFASESVGTEPYRRVKVFKP